MINNSNQFNVNIEGYEGPIDLLLELAKSQKVDLSKISILKLSEQYLEYINLAQKINLEIASDYLVMAAWLTYLKSRLLLPKTHDDNEPSGKELEEAMKFQLQRLDAMKNATKNLFNLPQIDNDIFYRGFNDGVKYKYKIEYTSSLFDLLKSYASQINKLHNDTLKIEMSELFSVDDAIKRIQTSFGSFPDWIDINKFIPNKLLPTIKKNIIINNSALSSTFVACLDLCKNGFIKIKQIGNFSQIFIKLK